MKRIISLTWKGCFYLSEFGHHPGTALLLMMIICGFIAGLDHGLSRSLFGAGLMAIVFGPIYLLGAYGRGKDHEEFEN